MADRKLPGKPPLSSHYHGSLPNGKELQPARRFLRPGALRKFQTSRHLANKKQQQHKLALILTPAFIATNEHMVVDAEPVVTSVDAAASETLAIVPVDMQPDSHQPAATNATEGENLAGDLAIVASQEMFVPAEQEYFYCPPPHSVSSRPVNKHRRKLYASPPCFILTRHGGRPQEDPSLALGMLAAEHAPADEDRAGETAISVEMALEPESGGTQSAGFSEYERFGSEISRGLQDGSDDHSASGDSHGTSESSDSHDSVERERRLEAEIHSESRDWQIVPFLGRAPEADVEAEQAIDPAGPAAGGRRLASAVACSPLPATATALPLADVHSPVCARQPHTTVATRAAASPLGGLPIAQQQLHHGALSPEPCTPPSIALATALRVSLSIGSRPGRSVLGQRHSNARDSRGTGSGLSLGEEEEKVEGAGDGACEERVWRAGGERVRMSSAVLMEALSSEGTGTAPTSKGGTTLDDMPHELLVRPGRHGRRAMSWDGMAWDGRFWSICLTTF